MTKDYQIGSSPYDNAIVNEYEDGSDPTLDLDNLELPIPSSKIIHTVLDPLGFSQNTIQQDTICIAT